MRLSPFRRRHLPGVQAIADLLEPLDRAIRNLRVLVRRAAIATWREEAVPTAYLRLLDALAETSEDIARELGERRLPTNARVGLQRIGEASAVIDPSAGLSGEVMRAQIRSMVVDLLMLTGLPLRRGARDGARVDDDRPAGRLSAAARLAAMSSRRSPHLPPVWLMALALVAVAANLRTAMASVPPLTESIADDLGLSNTALGALTTLPVLCMGLFAPFAQRIAARLGAAASIELSIACVAVGLALRFAGGATWPLYAGTFLAGVGIAIGGTLLPGLVKELFPPERAGLVTGLYMLAMMGGAGASSALSVPLEGWLGSWQAALGSWSLLAVVGVLAWVPVLTGHARHRAANPSVVAARPAARGDTSRPGWSRPTSPSSRSSSTRRWPGSRPSYTARGWDPTHAGYLLSVFTAAQLVSGLLAPALTDKINDRRVLLLSASVLGLLGQAGLWLAPTAAPVGLGDRPRVRAGRVVRPRAGADGRLRGHARCQRAAGRDGVLLQLHDRVVRTGEHGSPARPDWWLHRDLGHADGPDARPGRAVRTAAPGPAQGRLTSDSRRDGSASQGGRVEGDVRAGGRRARGPGRGRPAGRPRRARSSASAFWIAMTASGVGVGQRDGHPRVATGEPHVDDLLPRTRCAW